MELEKKKSKKKSEKKIGKKIKKEIGVFIKIKCHCLAWTSSYTTATVYTVIR